MEAYIKSEHILDKMIGTSSEMRKHASGQHVNLRSRIFMKNAILKQNVAPKKEKNLGNFKGFANSFTVITENWQV